MNPIHQKMLDKFRYSHLPPALQAVSKPFHDLAAEIVAQAEAVPDEAAEITAGLRKLWEAKNCVVLAHAAAPAMSGPMTELGGGGEFGDALRNLLNGDLVTRAGWNGPGMWLKLQVPDAHSLMSRPYIYMCDAQGELVPWLASQTDLLAQDWCVVKDLVAGEIA